MPNKFHAKKGVLKLFEAYEGRVIFLFASALYPHKLLWTVPFHEYLSSIKSNNDKQQPDTKTKIIHNKHTQKKTTTTNNKYCYMTRSLSTKTIAI